MDIQTQAAALKRRIEEAYRDEVTARGEAEAALARLPRELYGAEARAEAHAVVVISIERVRRAEDARRQMDALITTLGGL